ncbi:MAG: EAL domain-containing protein [Gammaproteobacteria bacterium]|nr:MAG: EAL domain-containing protein [Gammaproteobacteria bacterium]
MASINRGAELMAADPDSVFQSLDNGNSPLELLMIGCTQEEAARCASALRNHGQPVRLESTETAEGLMRLLETEPADLVTVNADSPILPAERAIEMVRAENPSAAIILLSENPPQWAEFAREMELRDLLHSISIGRLVFAIQREYQTLLLREELARTRTNLENAEARFRKLFIGSRDAIAYIHEGLHIQCNPVYSELFGLAVDEAAGLTMIDLVAPEDRDRLKKFLKKARHNDQRAEDVLFRHRTGSTFRADMELSPAEVNGEGCVQVVIQANEPIEALQARIDELIDRDPHTSLLHRHAFLRSLEALQTREGIPANGLLLGVSIDNFPDLSDEEGMEVADRLLERSAQILGEHLGDALLSRFGEHEFLAFMQTSTAPNEIAAQCLRALQAGELRRQCGLAQEPEFSLSVMSTKHARDLSIHEIIHRCRRAARHARQKRDFNDDPISVFNDIGLSPDAVDDVDSQIVSLIDEALEHDKFRLLYQPIVSLEGDTREDYAIYVRLLDAEGTEREPAWFYRHADQAERLAEIDRWVIRRAIRELAQHRAQGKKVNFHITLSREGALDDSMLLWVCDCLREFRAKGAWLYFQFDYALLREHPPALLRLAEDLRKINCKISCNAIPPDFSDYSLLSLYGVEIARFTPELSADLATDHVRRHRLKALNSELQRQNIRTVATCIENANTLAALWNIGINYVQGYFLQEPTPSIAPQES